MELLISIVSWNTRDLLRRCLASLEIHCRPDHARIVVIDNASSDGSPEMVLQEFPFATLIESGGNLGFGKAHNLIGKNYTEPFVLFLNPDTEFVEAAHERMLEVLKERADVGLVGCRMINLDGSVQPLGWQWHTSPWTELVSGLFISQWSTRFWQRLLPYHDPTKDGFVRKLYGGCLMGRRELLDRIGWFDERFFMYAEDVDLSRRVESVGSRLYYLSSAKLIHLCGSASAKAPGQFAALMQCESIAKLMEKYYGPVGSWSYILLIRIRALSRLAMVGFMRIVLRAIGRRFSKALEDSHLKQIILLRWSFGLEHPNIPV
jgi:GT2 family glycosyltransferase